jgi:hypothetical protein
MRKRIARLLDKLADWIDPPKFRLPKPRPAKR